MNPTNRSKKNKTIPRDRPQDAEPEIGKTPGTAEGDLENVEASLEKQED